MTPLLFASLGADTEGPDPLWLPPRGGRVRLCFGFRLPKIPETWLILCFWLKLQFCVCLHMDNRKRRCFLNIWRFSGCLHLSGWNVTSCSLLYFFSSSFLSAVSGGVCNSIQLVPLLFQHENLDLYLCWIFIQAGLKHQASLQVRL